MSDPKWKRFERLVAAIHQVDAQGAQVSWNETINGWQFDIVLRFSIGSYRYLTVIECKDQKRSVSVEDVEAFVTKSRDAGADKAVLVSSSGYQEGAFQVAERHRIELFGLSFVNEIAPELLHQELFPCVQIYQMKLRRADDASWLQLPDDRNLPPYLATHLIIHAGGGVRRLHELVDSNYAQILAQATSNPNEFRIPLPDGSVAYVPHLCEEYPVNELSFLFRITSFQVLKQPGLDPYLMAGVYEYRDFRSGQVKQIQKFRVQVRHQTVLRPGAFYYNPDFEFSYFCHTIEGEIATILLVESYQHGTLLQAALNQDIKYQDQYVEISDETEIQRLKRVGRNILRVHGAA